MDFFISSLEVHIEWWGCGGQLESLGTSGSCAAAGLGAPSCHWSQTGAGKHLSLRDTGNPHVLLSRCRSSRDLSPTPHLSAALLGSASPTVPVMVLWCSSFCCSRLSGPSEGRPPHMGTWRHCVLLRASRAAWGWTQACPGKQLQPGLRKGLFWGCNGFKLGTCSLEVFPHPELKQLVNTDQP